MSFFCLFASVLFFSSFGVNCFTTTLSENDMIDFLNGTFERESSEWCNKLNIANWDYETDIRNKGKEDSLLKITLENAAKEKNNWKTYFENLNLKQYNNKNLRRQLKHLKILGNAALDEKKLSQFTKITTQMVGIYSTAKVCPINKLKCDLEKEGLSLEPAIYERFALSRDINELTHLWRSWHEASGAKMRDLYKKYVELSNEAARANGFKDQGEYWLRDYETPTFVDDMDKIWDQVEPLYKLLLKYATTKLKQAYGDKIDVSDGLVPAHIFGNVWAQEWNNIEDILKPYPNATEISLNKALKKKGFTVKKMFETSNEFYTSMGLPSMEECYDPKRALIEKPTDGREVLCHASAWDFCDKKDFRIKMCTTVDAEDFFTIHHEMGHIEYYHLYKDLPYLYRDGANPGFHEAVGDTIALSVTTPKHLKAIGLIDAYENDFENVINTLMTQALQKIAFLPFGLLVDKWRWDVFRGNVTQDNWNSHWWKLRAKYQKMKPPVDRSDEKDFDPGAKFHVAGDSQYIAYFFSHIAQFQFYKALCIAAGEYDPVKKTPPLNECDFYRSKAAGDKFRAGLSLGYSEHWSVAMKAITGQTNLDASAILEYFAPLYTWLQKQS